MISNKNSLLSLKEHVLEAFEKLGRRIYSCISVDVNNAVKYPAGTLNISANVSMDVRAEFCRSFSSDYCSCRTGIFH